MNHEVKSTVEMTSTFDKLEMRLGKIMKVETAAGVPKTAYVLTVDFGKFGIRKTVGRFTKHQPEELLGALIVGVLNFGSRKIGSYDSEFLCLGVQYPGADSGEATILSPLASTAKIGGKVF